MTCIVNPLSANPTKWSNTQTNKNVALLQNLKGQWEYVSDTYPCRICITNTTKWFYATMLGSSFRLLFILISLKYILCLVHISIKSTAVTYPFYVFFLYELVTLASFSVLYVWNVYISSVLVYLDDIVLAIYYGSQIRVTTGGFELRTIK